MIDLINKLSIDDYQVITVVLLGLIPTAIGVTYKYVEKHFVLNKQRQEDIIANLRDELNEGKNESDQPNKLQDLQIFEFSGEHSESEKDLLKSLEQAQREIFVFGLTRNFYADDKVQKILAKKCREVPINIFMMAPECFSKKDRYRLEPARAAYKDASYYKERVEKPFLDLIENCPATSPGSKDPGISFHYYNFPCSFSMEMIDDCIRVFLYGLGKRGTDSPTFVFSREHFAFNFFQEQIDWIIEQVRGEGAAQWKDSNLKFTRLEG